MAQKMTEMESFIYRMGQTNQFTTISNIWQADPNFDKTEMLRKVDKAMPLTIDYSAVGELMKQKLTAITLEIPTVDGHGTYKIDLGRYDFLSNDFQVHAIGNNKSDGLVDYTPGVYYRGTVQGIKGSVAAFSFFNNEVYGIFSIPGEGNYVLVPNIMVGKYYDYNQHYVLYNDNDLSIKQFAPRCDADQLPTPAYLADKTTTTEGNNIYNNCTEVRVFEVGDYSLYTTKGHSVTNVVNYLTGLFNNQSVLYRNEGIPIVLKYVQVDTASDVYMTMTISNSGFFLDKFGYETQNVLHGCDLAILLSTRLNGSYGALGGVAWLKAMCTSYNSTDSAGPYAFCDMDNSGVTNFPTFSWDVEVATHEMGHVVGSPHTHRCCWNPPGSGTTAIDGCYTLEGSCAIPSPADPTGGGTIMSYCHLTSVGINFSNGFGQQPGDTVRYFLTHHFSSSCGDTWVPDTTGISITNRTLSANRECTDLTSGITYYWYDNNTASHADDTVILMVKKNGNTIGDLNTTGFAVTSATLPSWGTGTGQSFTAPTGVTGLSAHNAAMRRYWKINATTAPTSAVEVIFPFRSVDTADVDGSVPDATPMTSYLAYKVDGSIDPSPADGLTGATASTFHTYTYGTAASTANWSLTTQSNTLFAHMQMTSLTGGGTMFYTYAGVGVNDVNKNNVDVYVFPNPTSDYWNISVAPSIASMNMELYSSDGKLVATQSLKPGSINKVNAASFAPGVYYYRISGGDHIYTGNMVKK